MNTLKNAGHHGLIAIGFAAAFAAAVFAAQLAADAVVHVGEWAIG